MKSKETQMETILLILFLSIFPPVLSSTRCSTVQCDPLSGPKIRFPFRLKNRPPSRCGISGFDLTCNSDNRTVITLPKSGDFVVDHIDYISQTFFISDPAGCLANRIFNFSLSGSPFYADYSRNYTFLNCSSYYTEYASSNYLPLFCASGRNYTIMAADPTSSSPENRIPATCRRIRSVSVPMEWRIPEFYWTTMEVREDLQLGWKIPSCWDCESRGRVCGFKDSGPGSKIGCNPPPKSGLSRGAKYGIIIGVGIPSLVCIVGLFCYVGGLIRAYSVRRQRELNLPTYVFDQRPNIRSSNGLDQPTIESYPTTVLGESRRLPKPSDDTCPICLSDYEPKEILRSIPKCNHCFHAECIDEWLKSNATCPVCRNSPSSVETSSSITSLSYLVSFSSSSSSTTTLDRD